MFWKSVILVLICTGLALADDPPPVPLQYPFPVEYQGCIDLSGAVAGMVVPLAGFLAIVVGVVLGFVVVRRSLRWVRRMG